jgi:hypothetical protein
MGPYDKPSLVGGWHSGSPELAPVRSAAPALWFLIGATRHEDGVPRMNVSGHPGHLQPHLDLWVLTCERRILNRLLARRP